jgi:protein TonB
VPQLAASGASAAPKPLLGAWRYDLPLLSRRTVAFIAIAAVHVLIIYVFISGLAQHVVASIPALMHASVDLQSTPQHPLPVPPRTDLHLTRIDVGPLDPPPLSKTVFGPDPSATPEVWPPQPTDPVPPLPPQPPQRTTGGPGKDFPNTDDYYPATSRRMAESGAAMVRVCVDTAGRLTAEPTIAASSGSQRIDAGALNLAKAGSGHYRPTLEDGAAVSSCFPYRIRFTLAN